MGTKAPNGGKGSSEGTGGCTPASKNLRFRGDTLQKTENWKKKTLGSQRFDTREEGRGTLSYSEESGREVRKTKVVKTKAVKNIITRAEEEMKDSEQHSCGFWTLTTWGNPGNG